MRSLLLSVFAGSVLFAGAQRHYSDTLPVKSGIVTVSLLEYIPLPFTLNSGNFNVGKETFLGGRESIYINLGVIHSIGPNRGPILPSERHRGIKAQVEGRHYFQLRKIVEPAILVLWPHIFQFKTGSYVNSGYYSGVHALYQYTQTDRTMNAGLGEDAWYLVERDVIGLSGKIGYQCIKANGLVVDFSIGLGAAYVQAVSSNKPTVNGNVPGDIFDDYSGVRPHGNYHLRIGWGAKR